jgi:hypothetical protein
VIASLFQTNSAAEPGPGLIAPAVVAAVVAGCVSLVTLWFNHRRDRLERQRQLLADAFAACQDYKEFPFRVRRRAGGEKSVDERIRLNNALSDIQAELNGYGARLRVEAPRVAPSYAALVLELRRIAGSEISRAWDAPPSENDAAMHVTDVDLSGIAGAENAYLVSVEAHLSGSRRVRQRVHRLVRRKDGTPIAPQRPGLAPATAGEKPDDTQPSTT